MKHFVTSNFWACYQRLPVAVQKLADKNYELLKSNPFHPSLHFKQIGNYRAVRVGLHYRSLAIDSWDGLVWFWIGSHAEYERILKGSREK